MREFDVNEFYSNKFYAVFSVNQDLGCWEEFLYPMSVQEYDESWQSESSGCDVSRMFNSEEEAMRFGHDWESKHK